MSEVGTLAWSRRTGGRLTARDRASLAATGVSSQLKLLPSRAATALGLRRDRLARIDLDRIAIPDTAAVRDAAELCDELSPAVAAHSRRTYLWGAVLAEHDRIAYDPELLLCVSLVHDTGLPRCLGGDGDAACFTVESARDAEDVARRAGWDDERRERAAEAVTLHFNPHVSLEHGAEAHLLNAGAAVDVAGVRAWEIAPETREAVLARHPRLDFKREIDEQLRAHARGARRGRVAFMYRYGAFGVLIKAAPFDS
jgi:hypothetical protein